MIAKRHTIVPGRGGMYAVDSRIGPFVSKEDAAEFIREHLDPDFTFDCDLCGAAIHDPGVCKKCAPLVAG